MPRIHQLSLATLRCSAVEGARALSLALLDQVGATLPRLQTRKDQEALHDFRVAVRRLRACLRAHRRLFDKKPVTIWRKRLREIVTATGSARHAEVQLQWIEAQDTTWMKADLTGVNLIRERLGVQIEGGYRNGLDVIAREYPDVEKSLYSYFGNVAPPPGGPSAVAPLASVSGQLSPPPSSSESSSAWESKWAPSRNSSIHSGRLSPAGIAAKCS